MVFPKRVGLSPIQKFLLCNKIVSFFMYVCAPLRMRACCKFFKQEGQKVRKSIKLTIKTDILVA